MGLTSAQLDVVDLTPRIGSEIRTDLETLLSGREAANIRDTLEQRGVVFFRGLEISDEQQVAIAKTLGNIPENEGESGIYKISLDKNVNQRAEYLKGSMFWHFDGSLQPYPNLATLLRRSRCPIPAGTPSFATPTRRTTTSRKPTRISSRTFGWSTVPSARSTTSVLR